MGIQSALVIWNSTLATEYANLLWLTDGCWQEALTAAQLAYPNETCGLFVQLHGKVSLYLFRSTSTPWSTSADAQDVIDFVYWLEAESALVLATFHTHPSGAEVFSERDYLLCSWSHIHVLGVYDAPNWKCKVHQV